IIEIELALFSKHHDPQSRELLAATREVEQRCWHHRQSAIHIGQSVPDRVHHSPGSNDGERETWIVLANLIDDVIVDLRRALRLDPKRILEGLAAIPESRHGSSLHVISNR